MKKWSCSERLEKSLKRKPQFNHIVAFNIVTTVINESALKC